MKFLPLVLSFLLLACDNQSIKEKGPDGTWWVGGADGGVYVFIEDDENKTDQLYQGTIYYEHDLSVWYSGKFKYSKMTPLDYKDKSIYDGWDGEKLFLKNNHYLTAINPPD